MIEASSPDPLDTFEWSVDAYMILFLVLDGLYVKYLPILLSRMLGEDEVIAVAQDIGELPQVR